MKLSALVIGFLFTAQAFAAEEKYENHVIRLDWSKPSTLEDNVVQQCDDTYVPAVDIVIPGKPNKNFLVEMDADITNGKPFLGCSIKMKQNANSTTFTFDASNGGGCTIKVHKVRKDYHETPQSATYELSDAC